MKNANKKSTAVKRDGKPTARKSANGALKENKKVKGWRLRLYIAGQTSSAMAALENLRAICEEHLDKTYKIEVVDLLKNPTLAAGDQIIAVPTLVRKLPPPAKKIIGDLSNKERVLVGLDLRPIR